MAGYVTKHMGYLYQGELVNGGTAPVANGTLATITGGKMVAAAAADTTSKFIALEEVVLYDSNDDAVLANGTVRHAYRFIVDALNKPYYFVCTQHDVHDSCEYNTATMTTPVGAKVSAHPLAVGEEFVTDVVGTITVGNTYGVTSAGKIG